LEAWCGGIRSLHVTLGTAFSKLRVDIGLLPECFGERRIKKGMMEEVFNSREKVFIPNFRVSETTRKNILKIIAILEEQRRNMCISWPSFQIQAVVWR
jgi:hypothetical protein